MKEKKITPEELHDRVIDYNKTKPVIMEESEFSSNLKDTVIQRYKLGEKLMEEVKNTLEKLKQNNPSSLNEINKSIANLDEASNQLAYGHLGYNKAATGKPRAILWPNKK